MIASQCAAVNTLLVFCVQLNIASEVRSSAHHYLNPKAMLPVFRGQSVFMFV